MSNAGFDASAVTVDVSSRQSIHKLVEEATRRGDITGVIHAAGVSPSQASPETILKVDLYGTAVLLESSGTSSRMAVRVSSSRRSRVTDWARSPRSRTPRSQRRPRTSCFRCRSFNSTR